MPQGVTLHIPFESRISADLERARHTHLAWPGIHGLLVGPKAVRRHVMGSYAEVAARFHPTAVGDDLDLAVDQQSWFFLFDDFFDGPAGGDPEAVRNLTRDVAATLDDPHASVGRHPLVRAFADLWERSTEGMSAAWCARAAGDWRAYLSGYVDEALVRRREPFPSFSDHLALRTRTIGALPVLDMAERVGHYECPASTLRSPTVESMRRLALEVVILDNDIVSVEKEEAAGDINLVLLLEREQALSREEAIDRMCRMVADRTREFVALRERLPALAETLELDDRDRVALMRYDRDALQTLMRGAYDWDQHAERYGSEFTRTFVIGEDRRSAS